MSYIQVYVTCITVMNTLVPLIEAGGDHSNDHLPGHGGLAVPLQNHLPVVAALREDCTGAHTHPGGVLPNTDRVATVGDAGLLVAQVSIP